MNLWPFHPRKIMTDFPLPVHIRWIIRQDMPEVLAIEQESFEFPWSEDDFIRCLRQLNCIGMVAKYNDRVVGFMIYELTKTRIHVLNFAVAAAYRRRGVGSQMAAKLIGKLSDRRRRRIILEVQDSNLAAHKFWAACGFRALGVIRRFYARLRPECEDDAYYFQFRLPDESAVQSSTRCK